MRKTSLQVFAALCCLIVVAGCSGGTAEAEATPKGAPPNTVEAPAGAKNPEQRGMEDQKAAGNQDGGGQDGK